MRILSILALATFASTTSAQEITDRASLIAYLEEQMPAGQTITTSYSVGQELGSPQRFGTCKSEQTLREMGPVPYHLIIDGLMRVKVTKEVEGDLPPETSRTLM